MPFLRHKDQLRVVEWGRTYLWDIRFPDAPWPFSDWFPASEVTENRATLESQTFQSAWTTFRVPRNTTLFDLKVTFYDDDQHVLLSWLEEWINSTVTPSGTLPVGEVVRPVELIKYNSLREPLDVSRYMVYPEGGLYFTGTSQGAVPQYQVTFIIAGT